VRPEKYASAIWQKNGLAITSVNGSVVNAPPHTPVSAGNRVDAINTTIIVKDRIAAERSFSFIGGSPFCNWSSVSWELKVVEIGNRLQREVSSQGHLPGGLLKTGLMAKGRMATDCNCQSAVEGSIEEADHLVTGKRRLRCI
jgi:hypothetical protein